VLQLNAIHPDKFIYLKSAHSTNQYLSDYLSNNNPQLNLCVYSYNQTHGRGQIGREWFNGNGKNISLSYLIHFNDLNIKDQFYLNMAISLGLHGYLSQLLGTSKVKIKWPNDIYHMHQKLAGILIQNQIKGRKIASSIIGIGLNVNQEIFPENLPNPCSIFNITQKKTSLLEVVLNVEKHIFPYINLLAHSPQKIKALYITELLGLGEKRSFISNNGEKFEGIISGINQEGKLIVNLEDHVKEFNFREITFTIKS
jgi:BirA family biotin operon repressor/biotin-[acetyl-CoA-carboxylase] ligase